MNRIWYVAVGGALVFSAQQQAFAGAWTLPQGDSYNKFGIAFFESDDTFGPSVDGFEEFTDITLNYYAEYGITDNITLFGQIPLRETTNTIAGVETENSGVGDVDIGFRFNLLNEKNVLALQLLYKTPFAYNDDDELPLGNGQADFETRLQYGRSLYPYGYVGLEAGYRFRAEAPSDEIRYQLEYGIDIKENYYFRTKLDGTETTGSTAATLTQTGNPSFPLAFDLGRLELTGGYKISEQSTVEFTYTRNIYGDNILRGNTFQLAFVFAPKNQ
ncbi:MAG: hypothetical protein AAFX44_06105 [Pseudomonadota bacterium]